MISSSSIADAGYAPGTPVVLGLSSRDGEHFLGQGGFDGETVAYAASLAKQITGACAALLARSGMLDPDAAVAEWLPELPAWRERVRIRHLIHHTAGLPDVWPSMQRRGLTSWTSEGVLAALADGGELTSEPGSTYRYTSVGYICLAAVVERIAGTPFPVFAHTHVFEPLGMAHSVFWTGPGPAPPAAALVPEQNLPAPLAAGDGGLWTTVADLLRWNRAILDDALGVTAAMHTPGSLDDGTPLDYAWGVRVFRTSCGTVHSHGGDYGRATAKLVRLPEIASGFAALASDGSVERMVALSDRVRSDLAGRAGR